MKSPKGHSAPLKAWCLCRGVNCFLSPSWNKIKCVRLSVQCTQRTPSSAWWIWSSGWSRTTSWMDLWRFTSKWQVLCCVVLCCVVFGSRLYEPADVSTDQSNLCFRQIHISIQHMGTWSPTGMAVCTISCICSWLLPLLGGKSLTSVCLSACLSVCLSTCLPVCLSVCLSLWIMCPSGCDNGSVSWFAQGQLPSHWTVLGGILSHACHSLHSWECCG